MYFSKTLVSQHASKYNHNFQLTGNHLIINITVHCLVCEHDNEIICYVHTRVTLRSSFVAIMCAMDIIITCFMCYSVICAGWETCNDAPITDATATYQIGNMFFFIVSTLCLALRHMNRVF